MLNFEPMNTLLITPKSKAQEVQLRALADKLGLTVKQLSTEEKEDAALLRAMLEGERNPVNTSLGSFLKVLRN